MTILSGRMLTEDELAQIGFAAFGRNVRISNRASIYGAQHLRLGDHVRIDDFTVISASGAVTIGSYVHIANHCSLIVGAPLTFEDYSTISAGGRIFTKSDDYSGSAMTNPTVPEEYTAVTSAPVTIGRHVIIGASSVILPGSVLEEGVAVGAMSLVRGTLAGWGIYAGTPATFLRTRTRDLLTLEAQWKKNR